MASIPDRETCLDLLGRMCLIRRFEEEAGAAARRVRGARERGRVNSLEVYRLGKLAAKEFARLK